MATLSTYREIITTSTYTDEFLDSYNSTLASNIKEHEWEWETYNNKYRKIYLKSNYYEGFYQSYNNSPTTTTSADWYDPVWSAPPPEPVDVRVRRIMHNRQVPTIIGTRQPLQWTRDERELRARETLRRVVGEQRFRQYLKCGFITVQARSGLTYQIFPGHSMTCVWDKGQRIERLCAYLPGFPNTDQLITRYLMILNNEAGFRQLANRWRASQVDRQSAMANVDDRSLVEIFRELKAVA